MNGGTLRWPDEFVRHKAADIVGDLALTGARIRAHVVATRPSHGGNVALARALSRAAKRTRAPTMDIGRIMDVLPHRYPFLLVDRIIEVEGQQRIVGIKNVTINEPFFQGHFPGHPIMPGVLIIEAMAQVGGMLLMEELQSREDKVVYFMALDNVKFRRPVLPGDQIRSEVEMIQLRGRTCRLKGVGNPIELYNLNTLGLERAGFPADTIGALKRLYRLFFNSELNLSQAVDRARAELPPLPEVERFLEFVSSSQRGVPA